MDKIKVLVVDDSAYYRNSLISMLEGSSAIEVVGISADGGEAIRLLNKVNPDVITLDLEMPNIDGFTFLRWLMRNNPIPVIVISSVNEKASVFKALEVGAQDFIGKPMESDSSEMLRWNCELIEKIKAVSRIPKDRLLRYQINNNGNQNSAKIISSSISRNGSDNKLVAIGSSTGGPPAIQHILEIIPRRFPGTILISQHMPVGFTGYFAERLNKITKLEVKEAENGDVLESGKVFIAPGGYHSLLEKEKDNIIIKLKKSLPDDIYVPSIDRMMSSAAEIFNSKIIGVLLTGMGSDGKKGIREIKKRGGYTIAESEESAVIFGMPSEAIKDGTIDKVIPLQKIGEEIINRCLY